MNERIQVVLMAIVAACCFVSAINWILIGDRYNAFAFLGFSAGYAGLMLAFGK